MYRTATEIEKNIAHLEMFTKHTKANHMTSHLNKIASEKRALAFRIEDDVYRRRNPEELLAYVTANPNMCPDSKRVFLGLAEGTKYDAGNSMDFNN